MKTNFTLVFFFFTAGIAYCQDKFQKCCGERKLYFEGDCHTPLQQGPCGEGEWLIMERGRQEGPARRLPASLRYSSSRMESAYLESTSRGEASCVEATRDPGTVSMETGTVRESTFPSHS